MRVRDFVRRARDALLGRRNGHDELQTALAVRQATVRDREQASAHVRQTMRRHAGVFAFPVEDIGDPFDERRRR